MDHAKEKRIELRNLMKKLSKRLYTQCHGKGCRMGESCPQYCKCKRTRQNPLGLNTAMVWNLAISMANVTESLTSLRQLYRESNTFYYLLVMHKDAFKSTFRIICLIRAILHDGLLDLQSNNPTFYKQIMKENVSMLKRIPNLGR